MLCFLVMLCALGTAVTAYPSLDMSFRAVGTIYIPGEKGAGREISFEENYQFGVERTAITTVEAGVNSTIVEYLREKQAFLFKNDHTCQEFNLREHTFETDIRIARTDKTGQYVLPIHQLLTLNTSFLVKDLPEQVTLSSVPTNKWTFKIEGDGGKIQVDSFFSIPDAKTASAPGEIPLRFEIKRETNVNGVVSSTSQVVTVGLYTKGEFNSQVFRPRRGVYCAARKGPVRFPDIELKRLQVLKTKVEQVVTDFSRIGVIDTWFDPSNELYRINFSPIREQVKQGVQRIISHVQGVVYEVTETRKCMVKAVKDLKENFDPQTIFNPFDRTKFSMEELFGIGKVEYQNIGEVIERGIPCNLYQGVRVDWPPGDSTGNVKSLWEWCLADQVLPSVEFKLNGFPLVSLNVYVLESPYSKIESFYYKGLQLAYNFYEVRNNSKQYLDNLAFDIQECFEDSNQKRLEFRAKIHDKVTRELLERNARHQEHVAAWTDAIVKAAKLQPSSLRVASLQTRVSDEGLEVNFVLLGRHPALPKDVKEIPLDDAVTNVKTTLDNNQLAVSVELGSEGETKKVDLKGEPGTLKSKVIQDDDIGKGASGVSAATMAAVAVVMLVLGVSVGAAFIYSRKRKMYQRV